MNGLIGDVLDFARGRLGGGFAVTLQEENLVRSSPRSRANSARLSRRQRSTCRSPSPIRCVPTGCGSVSFFPIFSATRSCTARATSRCACAPATEGGAFELSVSNAGDEIPAATLAHLFKPFVRGAIGGNQQGLGLGLYIASEIAKAHGGTLEASSTAQETRFTFRMRL